MLLYKGGQIANEDTPKLEKADVLVDEKGRISRVGANLKAAGKAEIIDCTACVLMPAMFDVHVHAREPGQEYKENIATCSEAAINGGVTGIVLMPNTNPAIDSGSLVRAVMDRARQSSRIPIWQTGCVTKGRAGEELAGIAGMADAGVPMLTDDGDPVPCPNLLKRAMDYANDFGLPIASHCEVKELSAHGSMNEGSVSYGLGLHGVPAISEEICLDRDIRIAQYTGGHVHIQHVTSARGMLTIRRAKEDGIRVTCEVSPHHLIFNEEDIGDYDTNYKMNPPLRTAEDNEALLQGLIDGVFDVIATDHAPHSEFEKSNDFGNAPYGITGLETAVLSLYNRFIQRGRFGWDILVKRYSAEPRRLLGLDTVPIQEGCPAEFIVVDLEGETTFSKEWMRSKSSNTPFIDQTLAGEIRSVVKGVDCLK